MVDFLFALIELFTAIYYYLLRFRSYEAKYVQLGCFRRQVDLFALKYYLNRVVPHKPFLHQKTRDTGLPDGGDRIPLRSLVFTQYRSVTDRQTQTDGRTDLPWHIEHFFAAPYKMA